MARVDHNIRLSEPLASHSILLITHHYCDDISEALVVIYVLDYQVILWKGSVNEHSVTIEQSLSALKALEIIGAVGRMNTSITNGTGVVVRMHLSSRSMGF